MQIARVKSERAEAARKASYHYQQQLLHEEQWIPLECFGLQVVTMTIIIYEHNLAVYTAENVVKHTKRFLHPMYYVIPVNSLLVVLIWSPSQFFWLL